MDCVIERMLVLVFLLTFHGAVSHQNFTLSDVLLEKNEALSFIGEKRGVNKALYNSLVKDCCKGNTCYLYDRSSKYKSYSWDDAKKALCQMSIVEAKSCKCRYDSFDRVHECGTDVYDRKYCPKWCPKTQFQCGRWRKCIPKEKQCDTKNDCGNWEDEKGCTMNNQYTPSEIADNTKLVPSLPIDASKKSYYGLLYMFDRPVCGEIFSMKKSRAKVICKTIFPGEREMIASPLPARVFHKVPKTANYIFQNIKCKGTESDIGKCKHDTVSYICKQQRDSQVTIAVACLNLKTSSLSTANEGVAHIAGLPVSVFKRETKWKMHTANLFCTQALAQKYNIDYVPAYETDVNGNERMTDLCVRVKCYGLEKKLSECEVSGGWDCRYSSKSVSVKCAACSPQMFVDILNIIKYRGTNDEILDSVKDAQAKLKLNCRMWMDCNKDNPRYKTFCDVKQFIETIEPVYIKPLKKSTQSIVGTKKDYLKLLNNQFLTDKFGEIKDTIYKVGGKITAALGSYFRKLAEYDRGIAKGDVAYNMGAWKNANTAYNKKKKEFTSQIKVATKLAGQITIADIAETTVEVALAALNFINPISYVADVAGPALELKDRMGKLATAVKDHKQYQFLLTLLPKIVECSKRMQKKIEGNRKVFSMVSKLITLTTNNRALTVDDFTEKQAQEFIEKYTAFNPAVVKYETTGCLEKLGELTTGICATVEEASNVGSAALAAHAASKGTCPKLRNTVSVMKSCVDVLESKQITVMDSFAKLARAKLAAVHAIKVKQSVTGTVKQQVNKELLRLKSILSLRRYKGNTIKGACDYLTYMNYNTRPNECNSQLMANPDMDSGSLMAIKTCSMCECTGAAKRSAVVRIPASNFRDSGKSKGAVDLRGLYAGEKKTDGTTYLSIPGEDWLKTNGWIHEYDQGPFYIKKFNLFLPPSSEHRHSLKVSLERVRSDDKEDSILLNDGTILENHYTEGAGAGCTKSEVNPYNVKVCGGEFNRVCVDTEGMVNGELLPRLDESTWLISLQSKHKLTAMFPDGQTILYARAEFCYKKTSRTGKRSIEARHPVCCSGLGKNKYYNITSNKCEECPSGSKVRLFDSYCELCPEGYEPSTGKFGCQPCNINFFKYKKGSEQCKSCPPGMVASTKGSLTCTNPIETNPSPSTNPIKTNPPPSTNPIKTNPPPSTNPIKTNPQPSTDPIKTNPSP